MLYSLTIFIVIYQRLQCYDHVMPTPKQTHYAMFWKRGLNARFQICTICGVIIFNLCYIINVCDTQVAPTHIHARHNAYLEMWHMSIYMY